MNISSVVVKISEQKADAIVQQIGAIKNCEVHLVEGASVIVTIEGHAVEDEIKAVKKLEVIPGVFAVEMIYSYNEDELEQIRSNVEMAEDFPEWLNNEYLNAKQIPYAGDLKKQY